MKKPRTSVMFAVAAACAALGGNARAQVAVEPVAPPREGLAVERITTTGTACPDPDAVTAAFTPDGGALVLGFDVGTLMARLDPEDRWSPRSRSCQVELDLRIPPGYRMALRRVVNKGYASLDPGMVGRHMTRYWFLGTRAPARFAELFGPHRGTYLLRSDFGAEVVHSLCNLDRPLYIQSTIAVSNLLNPQGRGFMSAAGPWTSTYEVVWSRCSR